MLLSSNVWLAIKAHHCLYFYRRPYGRQTPFLNRERFNMNTTPNANTGGVVMRSQLVLGTEAFIGNTAEALWTVEGIERVMGFRMPSSQNMCQWTRGNQVIVICPETGYEVLGANAFGKAWHQFVDKHELGADVWISTTQAACGMDMFHTGPWTTDLYMDYRSKVAPIGQPATVHFLTKEFFEAVGPSIYWTYVLDRLLPRNFGTDYEGSEKFLEQFAKNTEAVLEAGLVRYTAPPHFRVCPVVTVIRHQPKSDAIGGSQDFPLVLKE